MGLAQAGVAVDKQGVVILSRVLGYRYGSGIRQLVGGPHHKRVKGKFVGRKPVILAFDRTVEFHEGRIVQDLYLKVRGEDIVEGGLDVFQEQRLDIALFEVVGAVENKRIAPDIHGFQFVEPGGNGSLRKVFLELLQDIVPHVSDRIQRETPLSVKNVQNNTNIL